VEDHQCKSGSHDHRSLKDQERGLVVGELAAEAALEFSNTVDATDEDGDGSECESCWGFLVSFLGTERDE